MPWEGPPDPEVAPSDGIAGGPGPTPPGLDDGTPQIVPAQPETPPAREAGEGERGPERREAEKPD